MDFEDELDFDESLLEVFDSVGVDLVPESLPEDEVSLDCDFAFSRARFFVP